VAAIASKQQAAERAERNERARLSSREAVRLVSLHCGGNTWGKASRLALSRASASHRVDISLDDTRMLNLV
jgi:hypothetical protein